MDVSRMVLERALTGRLARGDPARDGGGRAVTAIVEWLRAARRGRPALRAVWALLRAQEQQVISRLFGTTPFSMHGVRIRGAAANPRVAWHPNPAGTPARTLADALRIAAENGVEIDEEEYLFRVAARRLDNFAEYLDYNVPQSEGRTLFIELRKVLFDGRLVVWLSPDVLDSDDAIVAVIAHEVHETQALFAAFQMNGGRLGAPTLYSLVNPTSGTLHCAAWEYADELVRKRHGPANR
ncbi:MAG TPA: hypothetical protein VGI39_38890 [Polyangiaceae bacterium]|jgi:hypothetical protein